MPALPPSESLTFLAAVLIALGASAHCAGMCGGFAVAASMPVAVGRVPAGLRVVTPHRALARQCLYLAGKSLTYVFLGSVAGLFGAYLAASGALFWRLLACAAGAALIGIGAAGLGGRRALGPSTSWPALDGIARLFRAATTGLRRLETPLRPLYLGMLSGFLPCPLVYAFAARAAVAESFAEIVVTMLALGLGSAPVLIALGCSGRALSPLLGARLARASALLMIALGVWTIYRGFGAAPCCAG